MHSKARHALYFKRLFLLLVWIRFLNICLNICIFKRWLNSAIWNELNYSIIVFIISLALLMLQTSLFVNECVTYILSCSPFCLLHVFLICNFSGSLWVSVVLNPTCDKHDRFKWSERLESWSKIDVAPLEDPDFHHDLLATASARSDNHSVSKCTLIVQRIIIL
jgi:hypothetical protein